MIKELNIEMIMRKNILKFCFDQEYMAMKNYYFKKAVKNKNFLATLRQFGEHIDIKVRDHLIEEFFNNVCRKYCRLQIIIYTIARKMINKLRDQNLKAIKATTKPVFI